MERPDPPVVRESPKRVGYTPVIIIVFILVTGVIGYQNSEHEAATTTDSGTLVSYDGTTVETMVALSEGTPEWQSICDLTPSVGYDVSRQLYLDAEPQIGSDAYEGAVFDLMMTHC
jgi:hypothetical protein